LLDICLNTEIDSHLQTKRPDNMNSSVPIQSQQRQDVRSVSFGFYEPQNGRDIRDAVTHMARVAAVLELKNNIKVAIFKSIEHSWVWMYFISPTSHFYKFYFSDKNLARH